MDQAAAERVRTLAGDALARADAARAGLEELLGAVERLRAELGAPAPAPNGRPAAPAGGGPSLAVDAARLVAIEMAVAGHTREEVARHLRAAYAGPDTDAVLADVFGDV